MNKENVKNVQQINRKIGKTKLQMKRKYKQRKGQKRPPI